MNMVEGIQLKYTVKVRPNRLRCVLSCDLKEVTQSVLTLMLIHSRSGIVKIKAKASLTKASACVCVCVRLQTHLKQLLDQKTAANHS